MNLALNGELHVKAYPATPTFFSCHIFFFFVCVLWRFLRIFIDVQQRKVMGMVIEVRKTSSLQLKEKIDISTTHKARASPSVLL